MALLLKRTAGMQRKLGLRLSQTAGTMLNRAPSTRYGAVKAGHLAMTSGIRFKSTTTTTTDQTGTVGSIPLVAKTLGNSTEISADGQTHITTLANGVRLVSEANPGHFTALGVYVDAGSRYENSETAGFGHLMDRLAFRNSKNYSSAESMEVIEKLGGSMLCSSSRECIMYQAAVFPHDVGRAMGLLADTTLRPRFLEEDLEELRHTVPWELQDFVGKPDMFLPEKLHQVAYTGTLGNPLLCSPEQLERATVGSLEAYHRTWYRPERIVVAAVGMEHEEFVRLCLDNGFGDLAAKDEPSANAVESPAESQTNESSRSWFNRMLNSSSGAAISTTAISTPSFRAPAIYQGGKWLEEDASAEFTQVYMGFKSAGIDDEKALYTYAALQMLLGGGGSFSAGGPGKGMYSRLYTRVLNQHAWIESCVAFHHCYTDSGIFGISASCRPRNEHALMDVMAAELEAVAQGRLSGRNTGRMPYASQEGPTALEIRRAKNQLKSNLLMNLESRMVQLEDLGRQIQVAGRKVPAADMADHIENISQSDIASAAANLLKNPVTLLVQGKTKGVNKFFPKVAASHGISV
ncbi:Mitochondrial-processing peptidase subunit alpha [Coemansia sp. Benny D115]|nr:Mitochondrial-processing peptidase subunit alpha [Coemansia sp. Benny D115]